MLLTGEIQCQPAFNKSNENALIFQQPSASNLVEGTDFTADVFYETNTEIICIEIKTVKPNKGVFKGEKQKMLEAKAALQLRYPTKTIKYLIGFSFRPFKRYSLWLR